jgi:hypothetical protein
MDSPKKQHQMFSNLGKCTTETLVMVRQVFGKKAFSIHIKSKLAETEKGRSKVKSMVIIFFAFKGIVHKEFVLVGQTVNCT